MKRVKFVSAIILLLAIAAISMTACDPEAINDALKKAVWEYSATGETEINLNFAAVKKEDFKGIYEWDIKVTENSETKTYNVKFYADGTGDVKKTKSVIISGDKTFAVLSLRPSTGDATGYYIDETAKTATQTYKQEFSGMLSAVMYVGMYGMMNFTNENDDLPNWSFVEKRDAVSISDKDGNAMDTVEYEYVGVRQEGFPSDDVRILLNFKKVITPMLYRMLYNVYEDDVLKTTIEIFITMHTESVTEADFAIPTAEAGYTIE